MALPSRNVSTQDFPYLDSGVLLAENGDVITTEDGFGLLIDNPTQNPNLSTRQVTSFNAYPSRN